MISIVKSATPAVLSTKGVQAAKKHCAEYDGDPSAYDSGEKLFDFDGAVYSHDAVKAALRADQPKKCAFCESAFSHVGYGDVEHYRPKAGFRQRESVPLGRPGYYWLAYAWDNLFLSCQLCNQQFKRNLFPLRVQKDRALTHRHDVGKEEPLLVSPSDGPERHIAFVEEMATPRKRSVRGRVTIEVFGLNRPALLEHRMKWARTLKVLISARRRLARTAGLVPTEDEQKELDSMDRLLAEFVADGAEYAAMARAIVESGG
jgi:hypothetical protein